jgi:plastocyanin
LTTLSVIALPVFAHVGVPEANVPAPAVAEANIPVPLAQATARHHPFSPALMLAAVPLHPAAGSPVRLEVLHPPAGATDYRWDLAGGAQHATDTGSSPSITHTYASAGRHHMTVQMTVAAGTRRVSTNLTVVAPAAPATRRAHTAPQPGATAQAQPATPRETARARSAPRTRRVATAVRAHAAGDPAVTIADFQFTPGSVTVHVGNTITWTNNGPSTHTATARDGSFATGQLKKGQSASHTFSHAGTFTYFCQIHPFMHGTIVVLAAAPTTTSPTVSSSGAPAGAASTPSTSTGAGSTDPTASSTAAPSTASAPVAHSALPLTGLDVTKGLAIGLVLLGVGLALYRAAREPPA